jgi:hypothetical protein
MNTAIIKAIGIFANVYSVIRHFLFLSAGRVIQEFDAVLLYILYRELTKK